MSFGEQINLDEFLEFNGLIEPYIKDDEKIR